MFDSYLPPVVCKRVHVLFAFFVFVHSGVQHILCYVFLRFLYPVFLVPIANVYLKEKKKEEMWKQNISKILNKFDTRTNYVVSAQE